MTTGIFDLRVTDKTTGESRFYVMDTSKPMTFAHSVKKPQKPFDEGTTTLGIETYAHDVRFTEGRKSISFLDWSEGSGQQLYDTRKASQSRFLTSKYADIGIPGQLSILKEAEEIYDDYIIGASGPMITALGELWLGLIDGKILHSEDGRDWDFCTIEDDPFTTPISCITSDGKNIYLANGSGDETGVWWNPDNPYEFERYYKTSDNHTTDPITHIRWAAGTLIATTSNTAGYIEADGSYTMTSPEYVNNEGISVGLVAAESHVFWITSNGGVSKVYKLYYSPDADTLITEQYQEFPVGFIATCGITYSGVLDIGGYWQSEYSGVGKGTVYRSSAGFMQILFELGQHPEETEYPQSQDNDYRIIACTGGSRNTYWLTNRECYRWDVNYGGVSHVFDYRGAALDTTLSSQYQSQDMPTGGTITTDGRYTVHTFTGSGNLVVPIHYNKHGIAIDSIDAQYLIVGGGGAGGGGAGGGGGGGQVLHGSTTITGTMPVVIGAGAVAGTDTQGKSSSFDGKTAVGGGSGGSSSHAGYNGASGGGGSGDNQGTNPGGHGNAGYDGGSSATNYLASSRTPAGGGGGATQDGGDAVEEDLGGDNGRD